MGGHRHGLHEPQPGRARRPRVRLHRRRGWASPRKTVVGHVERPRRHGAGRHLGARRRRLGRPAHPQRWPASATTCATSPSPRATRPRPRSASASRSTPGASTTSSPPSTRSTDAEIDALVAEYEERYDVAPELRAGRRPARRRCATAPRIELGLRAFLEDGGFGAFTTNFEDLGGLRQLPGLAVQRLMADGYGFGAEGDWKTALLVRAAKVMGYGLPGGASLMEDYTYDLTPGQEKILGAHMLEVCPSPDDRRRPTLRDPPARHRRPGGPGPAGLRHRPRARASSWRMSRHARPVPAHRQRRRRRRARRRAAQPARGARGLGAPPRLRDVGRRLAHRRRAHHTVLSTAVGRRRRSRTSPRSRGIELLVIDETTTRAASPRSCAGTRPTTGWPRLSDASARAVEHTPDRPSRTGVCSTRLWGLGGAAVLR